MNGPRLPQSNSNKTYPTSVTDRPSRAVPIYIRSEDLLRSQREIVILHSQEVYRLRLTRNGKLILTK